MQKQGKKREPRKQAVVFQLKNEKINFTHVVEKRETEGWGGRRGGVLTSYPQEKKNSLRNVLDMCQVVLLGEENASGRWRLERERRMFCLGGKNRPSHYLFSRHRIKAVLWNRNRKNRNFLTS
jgi:hypothetical protein